MVLKRFGWLGISLALLVLFYGGIRTLSASNLAAAGKMAPPPDGIAQISPDELEPSVRAGNRRLSTATGQPLVLYAVNYPVTAGTPAAMARQYLQENAALLHLQATDLSDLEHTHTHHGPAGPTVRFRQVVDGIPVYKSDVVVHLNNRHTVTYVANDYKSALVVPAREAALTAVDALQISRDYLGLAAPARIETAQLMWYVLSGETHLVYRVNLVANEPLGDWEAMIDAGSGQILKLVNQSLDIHPADTAVRSTQLVTGTGNVFDPDPLSSANASYGDTGFVDGNDADTPQLNGELVSVTLEDITFTGGMYHLDGTYAAIRDTESPFKGLFSQATNTWNFNRFNDAFEAANTYYHIDASMRYINETLGVPVMPYQYSGGVRFDPHGLSGADNSHYSTGSGEVAFGEGGVDDAEDSDVIHHELGHGLHDWVTNGGLSQVNGLSEGFGDYWAQSYNRSLGLWGPADPPYNWVFNWDGHNPFWPGRVTNWPNLYPGGLTGQIHTDGQIWSTCNMRVWNAIGREQLDRAMLEGLAMTNSSTNQEDAANATYQAAIDMGYPVPDLVAMHDIYVTCVYQVPDVPAADFGLDVTPAALEICTTGDAVYTVDVADINGFGANVTLAAAGLPAPPNTVNFSTNNQAPPFTSMMTVGTSGASSGLYTIDVTGMSPTTTHTATVTLDLTDSVPGTAVLNEPPDGTIGVDLMPTFSWMAASQAEEYYLEVATDSEFNTVVYSTTVTGTSHTTAVALDPGADYYWRVLASNICGLGLPGDTFHFVTEVFGVDMSGDMVGSGTPGAQVAYTIHLTNTGNVTDTFALSSSGHNWDVAHPATVTLGAGAHGSFVVTVTVPISATAGDDDSVMVTAVSQGDGVSSGTVTLTTTAVAESGYQVYLPFIQKP